MLEIGVHLQNGNSVVRILKRTHSGITPSLQLEITGGAHRTYFLYIVSFTMSTVFLGETRGSFV
jgi:hypothetical protein